jgi:hypothetical protein
MDLKSTYVVKPDMTIDIQDEVERFKNAGELRGLISEFYNFKTGDELGLIRPEKQPKQIIVNPTELQLQYAEQAQELFNPKIPGGVLVGISEMQNITLSPYLSRYYNDEYPTYKEFVENSPKIAITMQAIKENKESLPEGNQIIYMPRVF